MNSPAAVSEPIAVSQSPLRPRSRASAVTARAATLSTTGKWLMIKWAYGQDNIYRSSVRESLTSLVHEKLSAPSGTCCRTAVNCNKNGANGHKSVCKPPLLEKLG